MKKPRGKSMDPSPELVRFTLRYVPPGAPSSMAGFEGETSDFGLFKKLCLLLGNAHLMKNARESMGMSAGVKVHADSAEWAEAQGLLQAGGLVPVFTSHVRPADATRQLPVQRDVPLTAARLDACEYLGLCYGDARVGYHVEKEGDNLIGMAEKSEYKKSSDIGSLAPTGVMAVSQNFCEVFKQARLKGAVFHPIQWRPLPGQGERSVPRDPARPFWLSGEKEMPRCLTPRVGFSGDLTGVHFWDNEELIKHAHPDMECGWDDEGRIDLTLRFRRQDVAAMGEFDIARTYEWTQLIGEENPAWYPLLIVSQRFRQWAAKQRYKLHYVLGELVG